MLRRRPFCSRPPVYSNREPNPCRTSRVTRGKDSTCQCRRGRFDPWVRKIPWRRARQPTSVFLPGKSPEGQKELDTTEQTHTIHFSVRADRMTGRTQLTSPHKNGSMNCCWFCFKTRSPIPSTMATSWEERKREGSLHPPVTQVLQLCKLFACTPCKLDPELQADQFLHQYHLAWRLRLQRAVRYLVGPRMACLSESRGSSDQCSQQRC